MNTRYMYRHGNQWLGPIPIAELEAMLEAEKLTPETDVRCPVATPEDVLVRTVGSLASRTSEAPSELRFRPRGEVAAVRSDSEPEITRTTGVVSESLDKTSEAIELLGDASELSAKVFKNAAKVGELNDLAKTMAGFGKLAPAFGFTGIVLGGITTVLSWIGKSEGEMTLEMLEKLLSAIDSLRNEIEVLFERLGKKAVVLAAKIQIQPHVLALESLIESYDEFQRASADYRKEPNPVNQASLDDCISRIGHSTNRTIDLTQHIDALVKALTTTGEITALNLFEAIYDSSYGDAVQIAKIGTYFMHLAALGVVVDGCVTRIQWKERNPGQEPTEDILAGLKRNIERIYRGKFDRMAAALEYQVLRCQRHLGGNLANQLDALIKTTNLASDYVLENGFKDHSFRIMASAILDQLRENHTWLDLTVFVYEPRKGSSHEYLIDPSGRFVWRHRTGDDAIPNGIADGVAVFGNSEQANVLVRYDDAEDDSPAVGSIGRIKEFTEAVALGFGDNDIASMEIRESGTSDRRQLESVIATRWGSWAPIWNRFITPKPDDFLKEMKEHYPRFCCSLWMTHEGELSRQPSTAGSGLPNAMVFVTKGCSRLFHATSNDRLCAIVSTGMYSACIAGNGRQSGPTKDDLASIDRRMLELVRVFAGS